MYKNGWGLDEEVWKIFYPSMRFIEGMTIHKNLDNGFRKAPEAPTEMSNVTGTPLPEEPILGEGRGLLMLIHPNFAQSWRP